MKILWMGNIILPEIARQENKPEVFVGGWIVSLAKRISMIPETKLCYVFSCDTEVKGKTVYYDYYGVSCHVQRYDRLPFSYTKHLIQILRDESPDIIHIWGTEYQHSLAMIQAAKEVNLIAKTVISIQGMASVYAHHYYAYLPEKIIHGFTIKDIIKGNLKKKAGIYQRRGKFEEKAIQSVNHVIGRTDWDRAVTKIINPDVIYHFNNEILREEFYTGVWDYKLCEKHSIFCSQAHYPIKGLHLMLEAMNILKDQYSDLKLYIGGKNYYTIPLLKRDTYEKYILRMIQAYGLKEKVYFTGNLNAEKMKEHYLKSNIFVSPSSIENSPNSVGEAMLLGVPVVSSRVGGVHNMLTHGKEGFLYPADEPYMLVYYIDKVFKAKDKISAMASCAQIRAKITHDPERNVHELLKIYDTIKENK